MPKSHDISASELKSLMDQVCRKFGRPILSVTDTIALSEIIQHSTGIILSINTIRRFFGLIETTSKPTQETLNTFSKYCGFNSYYDFQRSQTNTHQQNHTLSFHAVNSLYSSVSNDGEFFRLLSWLIKLSFKEDDSDLVLNLFNLEVFKKGYDYTHPELWSTAITLGLEMRKSPDKQELLSKHYAQNPIAQSLYFELFVDHDLLPTRHFKSIVEYSKNKMEPEAQLFGNCLLFLRSLMIQDFGSCDSLVKRIGKDENDLSLHPYPTARKIAYTLIHNYYIKKQSVDHNIKSIFQLEEKMPRNGGLNRNVPIFHMVVAEALVWCGKFDEAMELINSAFKSYPSLIDPKSVAENAAVNKLNTYYAKCLFEIGDKVKAKQVFSKVDIDSFDIQSRVFDSMHYYKIGYDLTKRDDVSKARIFKRQVATIAESYNFTFFKNIYA